MGITLKSVILLIDSDGSWLKKVRINDSKDLEEDYSSKLEIRIDRNPEIDQKSLK